MDFTTALAAIVALVDKIGFPIAVAAFVVWRIEPALHQLRDAIADLRGLIASQHVDRRQG